MNLTPVVIGLTILVAERFRAGPSAAGRFRLLLRATALTSLVAAITLCPTKSQLMDNSRPELPTIWACIDVSRSMSTRDVVPDRLARAQSILQSIMPALNGFPVGVISFAGAARLVCPPTSDLAYVGKSVGELSIGSAPSGGSNLLAPFEVIDGTEHRTGDRRAVIILLSDGGHRSLPADRIPSGSRQPMVIAIGVGNPGVSAPMPEETGGFSTTTTRLDEAPLQLLADRSGGVYIPARTSDLDGAAVLSRILKTLIPEDSPILSRRLAWVLMLAAISMSLFEPAIELLVHRWPSLRVAPTVGAER